jgi:4-hydroxybenzoate polyprenyltransferase
MKNINTKQRVILLALYAVVMFSTIAWQINMLNFIALFVVAPVVIYFFVKKIFPKEVLHEENI